jgi:hypothetical protein
MEELGVEGTAILKNTSLNRAEVAQDGTMASFIQALKVMRNN